MWEGKGVVKTGRVMLGETDPVYMLNNCEHDYMEWIILNGMDKVDPKTLGTRLNYH